MTTKVEPMVEKWEEIEATIRFSKSDYAVKVVKEYVAQSVQEAKAKERSRIADIIESHRDNIHDDISDLLTSLKQEEVQDEK